MFYSICEKKEVSGIGLARAKWKAFPLRTYLVLVFIIIVIIVVPLKETISYYFSLCLANIDCHESFKQASENRKERNLLRYNLIIIHSWLLVRGNEFAFLLPLIPFFHVKERFIYVEHCAVSSEHKINVKAY